MENECKQGYRGSEGGKMPWMVGERMKGRQDECERNGWKKSMEGIHTSISKLYVQRTYSA